ncbi:transcription factor E [Sulfodiicoccus acidiphilus]|uniref:transcription factor E n=1 Tax=Sulfodiicoccus acidiphilus TaxID=1670455 RepID=UPI001472C9A5|nr:transcription factor E [Sulfodiicoccus acidiphilus]
MKELAVTMLGDEVLPVLEILLKGKSELTDDEIARMLNVKVNNVRRTLYMLADHGLVRYKRTRDRETGWYLYYWRANTDQVNEILLNRKREMVQKLKMRLEFETNNTFYICPEDGSRYIFDEAFENEFKCPRCGTSLVYYEVERVREVIERKIRQLEEEINVETKSNFG